LAWLTIFIEHSYFLSLCLTVLFRRGQAYLGKKDLDKAKADLEAAEKLLPGDALIKAELAKLAQAFAEHQKKEKNLYAKMFSKMQDESA